MWENEQDGAGQPLSPRVRSTMTLHRWVTVELAYSSTHARHEVLACPPATLCGTPA